MAFFKKKAKEPVQAKEEPAKTETVDMGGVSAKQQPAQSQPKLSELIGNEWAGEWQDTFDDDSQSLLLAIYGELRLIRDAIHQQMTK